MLITIMILTSVYVLPKQSNQMDNVSFNKNAILLVNNVELLQVIDAKHVHKTQLFKLVEL